MVSGPHPIVGKIWSMTTNMKMAKTCGWYDIFCDKFYQGEDINNVFFQDIFTKKYFILPMLTVVTDFLRRKVMVVNVLALSNPRCYIPVEENFGGIGLVHVRNICLVFSASFLFTLKHFSINVSHKCKNETKNGSLCNLFFFSTLCCTVLLFSNHHCFTLPWLYPLKET